MKDIYDILREVEKRRGEKFALATLVRREGSSYRRPGARLLICEDGSTIGSLSGGCIEEEVAARGLEVLRTGEPALMSFDTRNRFGCNGKIDILVERVSEKFFVDLAADLEARRSFVATTTFEGEKFVQEIHPPIRVLIFGEGPESAPLSKLCHLLGWETIEIIDPNLLPIRPDEWTAAIVKTHNYGRDFAALQKLLPLNLRYVGLMGPRKRRDQLLNDLLDRDVTINAGFFAPAGLDLAAETPEEIALAIVSEIQRVFAIGTGFSLRERKMPIHAGACETSAR
ncbi:MAG: xanthine dehydrogenase accessory factor [Verrucomicrobiota bacterium]